jgi:hypothetical protein
MVHIGCGADVIRQRRRADQLRKENEANGIFFTPPGFKPAKNKKYPHYTPLRNANIFSERQQLSFVRKRAIYCLENRTSLNTVGRHSSSSSSSSSRSYSKFLGRKYIEQRKMNFERFFKTLKKTFL